MLGARGKSKRPSYTDMVAKVASLIDGFREQQGLEEFSQSRLSVIITTDYKAVISDGRFTPNPLLTVPLNELLLDFSSGMDGMMRHVAIDVAARIVVDQLGLEQLDAEPTSHTEDQGRIPFSPSIPDITKTTPIRGYSSGPYLLLLSRDVLPIGGGNFFKYKFVMTVIDKRSKNPRCFATLENSPVASNILCIFEPDGSRSNCGPLTGSDLMNEFIVKSMRLLDERFDFGKIDELAFRPVRTGRKQGKVIAVALAIVVSLVIGFWKDIVALTPAPPSQKPMASAPPVQPLDWMPVERDPLRLRPFEHGKTSFRAMPKETRNAPIRILTNAGDNYFVKLVRRSEATAIMTATIQGGTPFEARLPRGEYELRYAAGKSWYGEADLFGKDTAFAKTDRFISVSSDGIRTVQLILQRNGNLSSSTIPRENF